MARLARIVVPGVAHHVTQRGNRRLPVFFSDDDRRLYLALLAAAHRRYTRHVNFREGWRGHLFQGRFASYPMDDAHLMAAVRYVELNPVAAKRVDRAEGWRWSSARSHLAGMRTADDPLTDVAALGRHVRNWRAMLRVALEAGGLGEEGEVAAAAAIDGRRMDRAAGSGARTQPGATQTRPETNAGSGTLMSILSPGNRKSGAGELHPLAKTVQAVHLMQTFPVQKFPSTRRIHQGGYRADA
jgi:putative transposase